VARVSLACCGAVWLSLHFAACAAGEPQGTSLPRVPYRNLTREQIALLLTESDVDAAATQISAMAQDSHNEIVCGTLRSLWTNPRGGELPLPYETASATLVRLALASTLAQCKGGTRPEYYDFVRQVLRISGEEQDRSRAALALGIVGTDRDAASLLELATSEHSRLVATSAVAGLGILGSEHARQALTEVTQNQALDPLVRNLAQHYLDQK
jgi:HEAT repeat protein